jgi:hypothetical protein
MRNLVHRIIWYGVSWDAIKPHNDDVKNIHLRVTRASATVWGISGGQKELSRQFRDEALIEPPVRSLGRGVGRHLHCVRLTRVINRGTRECMSEVVTADQRPAACVCFVEY